MHNAWRCLEELPGLTAVPAVWRGRMTTDFESFRLLCLQPGPEPAPAYPCPLRDSCYYDLIAQDVGPFLAICQDNPVVCPNTTFSLQEITPLELNWQKLGRAICKALDLVAKFACLAPPDTCQVGSWSADEVPLILTIQTDTEVFQRVIAELALRLRRPYILLAPTTTHIDAIAQELLADANAGFFPLDTTIRLTDHGTLCALQRPGGLFAKFTPQPKDSVDEGVARQTLALAKALDSEQRCRKAPIYKVFLLCCMEGLTVNEIAKKCGCVRSLVFTRLKALRQKLGRDPRELRQYSAHFESIEQSLSDPRARNIYRQGEV